LNNTVQAEVLTEEEAADLEAADYDDADELPQEVEQPIRQEEASPSQPGGTDVQPVSGQKRGRKLDLLDADTARAILAEPFDEADETDRPIPDDFVTDDSGARAPLPGVLSVFLTGTTLDILGCSHLSASASPPDLVCTVTKDAILKDIQFRGAISDFHAHKQAIVDADCDPVVLRLNESDKYGDGNNVEVAVKAAAAEVWNAKQAELQRRQERDAILARRRLAEKSLPANKVQHKVRSGLLDVLQRWHC
jgi:hypothetical protein